MQRPLPESAVAPLGNANVPVGFARHVSGPRRTSAFLKEWFRSMEFIYPQSSAGAGARTESLGKPKEEQLKVGPKGVHHRG